VTADSVRLTSVHRRAAHIMGMPISLALRGRHVADVAAEEAWQEALAELDRADRMFSTYRDDSVVSKLDRGVLGIDDCTDEVMEVLALGERARLESGGAFDVRRPDPGGVEHLDPSGVVKGWAVDRAAKLLRRLPDTDFCLSAGGDMVCHTVTGAPPWRVGIEDPHQPSGIVAMVPVANGAVATSGLVHRGAHVVDARTGRVPTALASVTVVGPDLVWTDIDATAAFALGAEAAAWLRSRGRTALLVWADGDRTLIDPGTPAPNNSSD
jgi:thiamine biosynthesis lipoprotein